MKIKAVVFDYGGVISKPQNREAFFPWAEKETGLREEIVRKGWTKYRHEFDGGAISGAEMYRKILTDAGIDASDPDLCEMLAARDLESWAELNPDTFVWAQELKAAGYRLGILTNMPREFIPWFEKAKEFRLLADEEVVSSLVGKVKPNPDIYCDMIDRLNLPPDRILFFDDAVTNVEGARAVGLNSEIFTSVITAREALDRYNA